MKKKDYLIIDRSKWRSGGEGKNKTGLGSTKLLNQYGHMCCLGFRCNQMGIPKRSLLDNPSPAFLSRHWDIPDLIDNNKMTKWYTENSEFTMEAIMINDNKRLSSKTREKRITDHFKTIGVTVEFKGKYETN